MYIWPVGQILKQIRKKIPPLSSDGLYPVLSDISLYNQSNLICQVQNHATLASSSEKFKYRNWRFNISSYKSKQ